MLTTLIASRPTRTTTTNGTALSLALHVGVIATMFVATTQQDVFSGSDNSTRIVSLAAPSLPKPAAPAPPRTAPPRTSTAPTNAATVPAVDVPPVDVPAALRSGSPLPRYPDILRQSRIEGGVRVRFVVNEDGRADLASLVVLESTHPAFVESVRAVLPRLRFTQARVGRDRVKQVVEVPFGFQLR